MQWAVPFSRAENGSDDVKTNSKREMVLSIEAQNEVQKAGEPLKIIPATEADVPLIFSFIKSLADHVNLSHEVVASEQDIRASLFSPGSYVEVLIGYQAEQPVSFVIFYPSFSTFLGRPGLHIEDFYIKPECRGMGLGKAMFSHLAELALQRNCGKIDWYAAEWNENAIAFYTSMGAEKLDKRKLFRLTDDAMQQLVKCSQEASKTDPH